MINDDNIRAFSRLAAPVHKADGSHEIDLWRLATEQGVIESEVRVAGMSRLSSALTSGTNRLQARIAGLTVKGKPALKVSVQGSLSVVCQRCLGPMSWSVEVESDLMVERALPEEADGTEGEWTLDDLDDVVVVGPDVTVESLIEDELLLSLPLAPMHDSCVAPAATHDPASRSPFAVLSNKFGKHSKE